MRVCNQNRVEIKGSLQLGLGLGAYYCTNVQWLQADDITHSLTPTRIGELLQA